MSNEINIKKIEYDFEIDNPKIQKLYTLTCKKITEELIGDILIRLLKDYDIFQSNKNFFIDKFPPIIIFYKKSSLYF